MNSHSHITNFYVLCNLQKCIESTCFKNANKLVKDDILTHCLEFFTVPTCSNQTSVYGEPLTKPNQGPFLQRSQEKNPAISGWRLTFSGSYMMKGHLSNFPFPIALQYPLSIIIYLQTKIFW